jgi:hypothetical protein
MSPLNEIPMQGWIIILMDDDWNWLTKWNESYEYIITPRNLCLWMKLIVTNEVNPHLLHEFHVYIIMLKLHLGGKLNHQTRGNGVSSWFDETITRSFMLFQNEMNSCLEFFFIHKYSFRLLTSVLIHLHAMNEHHKMLSMNFSGYNCSTFMNKISWNFNTK